MRRHLLGGLGICATALAFAAPVATAATLVPIDQRFRSITSIDARGWVAGSLLTADDHGSTVAVWQNGNLVRVPTPAGAKGLGGTAILGPDGSVLATAVPDPLTTCSSRAALASPSSPKSGATYSSEILPPLDPTVCTTIPTAFAGTKPVGIGYRNEYISAEPAYPYAQVRAVDLRTGSLLFEPPPTIQETVDQADPLPDYYHALVWNDRVLAANANGWVIEAISIQEYASFLAPNANPWRGSFLDPKGLAGNYLRDPGGTRTRITGGDVLDNQTPNPTGTHKMWLLDTNTDYVLTGNGTLGFLFQGTAKTDIPFGISGASPDGRIVGNLLVAGSTLGVAAAQVYSARGWTNGTVEDLNDIARKSDSTKATWVFSALTRGILDTGSTLVNDKGSVVLRGCPPEAFAAGAAQYDDPACQWFRLDRSHVLTGVVNDVTIGGGFNQTRSLSSLKIGKPHRNLAVLATDVDGNVVKTSTDATGHYSLSLTPGTWTLTVGGNGGCFKVKGGACQASTTLDLKGEGTDTLNALANPPGPALKIGAPSVTVRAGGASIAFQCRLAGGCAGQLLLKKGTKVLGQVNVKLAAGAVKTVRVPLTKAGKAAVAAAASTTVKVSLLPKVGKPIAVGVTKLLR